MNDRLLYLIIMAATFGIAGTLSILYPTYKESIALAGIYILIVSAAGCITMRIRARNAQEIKHD